MFVLALVGFALGNSLSAEFIQIEARTQGSWVLFGDGDWNYGALAQKSNNPIKDPIFVGYSSGSASFGNYEQPYLSGLSETGFFSGRISADSFVGAFGVEAELEPVLVLDDSAFSVKLPKAWLGYRRDHLLIGFGKRDRWLGPARRGPLLLSNNASPVPMVNIAGFGKLPKKFSKIGLLRAELGLGIFDQPRSDVNRPMLLMMDFRWEPIPYLEFGLSRLSIFGGEGRPLPSLGQIILPTDPHVYDDPEKEEPDQNEQASFDVRANLPVRKLFGVPIDYFEGYWQYGAEDMIVRHIGVLPIPSLAGVANTYGLELNVSGFIITVERSQILDDYFRWYVGHRVYHEGFTQNDLVLGHHSGGDSRTNWYSLAYVTKTSKENLIRGSLAYEDVLRVGIVEALNDNLFALAADEQSKAIITSFAIENTRLKAEISYTFEFISGDNFVPNSDVFNHRVFVDFGYGAIVKRPSR